MSYMSKAQAMSRAKSPDFIEQAEALYTLRQLCDDPATFMKIVKDLKIGPRKARYLINIYDHLTERGIPPEEVRPIGWTKLKDIYHVLTKKNVRTWARRVENMSTIEVQEMLEQGGPKVKKADLPRRSFLTFRVTPEERKIVEEAVTKAGAVQRGRHLTGRSDSIVKICQFYKQNA
jgi:hypothetical protein